MRTTVLGTIVNVLLYYFECNLGHNLDMEHKSDVAQALGLFPGGSALPGCPVSESSDLNLS